MSTSSLSGFQQAVARIYAQHYGQGNANPMAFQRWLRTMSVHPQMSNPMGQHMIASMSQQAPIGTL